MKMKKNLKTGCQRNKSGFISKNGISGFRLTSPLVILTPFVPQPTQLVYNEYTVSEKIRPQVRALVMLRPRKLSCYNFIPMVAPQDRIRDCSSSSCMTANQHNQVLIQHQQQSYSK